jgi:serine/threonine protein kinase
MIELRKGVEIGGCVLVEPLAAGGMGQVWVASQPLLARRVALKVIRTDIAETEETRQRFIIEARSTASISHPNVIHIYDVGQLDGLLFIAMELIDGPSLRDVLKKEVFLSPERAVPIVCQIASALSVAHERGLVHRDVKPANILLSEVSGKEHAYLADFGLARVMATSGLTASGESIGTPAYMSPEQVRGDSAVDGRADIYGLGCVLFQTLTGDVPFPRDETHAIYYAHMEADPPRCSECNSAVPDAFDDVVTRALAKDPEDRYPSASDFEEACRAAFARADLAVAVPAATVSGALDPHTLVLVRQLDPGAPVAHVGETCSLLRGVVSPPKAIGFAGPGTAGWIPYGAAAELGATHCGECLANVAVA